jgi:DNA-directed RNA polymerase I and III subunit RPAC1
MVFDLIGVEPPLANALRRILISEIPTMAIEIVNMYQNTSIIPDEVLSHRIGLIPLLVDANEFQYKKQNEEFNEFNSIYFKLHIKCEKNKNYKKDSNDSEFINDQVLSSHLIWTPIGNQTKRFEVPIGVVHDDILIAKLRPGQEIEAELICVKGIGKTHAKWSPVSTAYYRLLPEITIKSVIKNEQAYALKSLCPTGVFDIEDFGKECKAVVRNPRNCTTCRECIRQPEYNIELSKVDDHYECNIV